MNNILQRGMQAHQRGDLNTARQCYLQQLTLNPVDANAKQLLGLVCAAQGDTMQGIRWIKESLQINPNQPHTLHNLAQCQLSVQHHQDAISTFKLAIELKVDYLEPYKSLVSVLLDLGNLDEAQKWLEQGLGYFAKDFSLLSYRAQLYQQQGLHALAQQQYAQLLSIKPDSVVARHGLALSLRLQGCSEQALPHYQKLLDQGVDNFQLYHNTANALSDIGQLQQAVKYYRMAIEHNPAYIDSHINLNELLWELDQRDQFLQSYQRAFVLVPENIELRFAYARGLLKTRNYQACHDFLSTLPESFKASADYYDLLGSVFKGIGNISVALHTQQQGLQINRRNQRALINHAVTLLESGRAEEAQTVIQSAIELSPQDKHAWALMGICWRQLGDEREAILNDYCNLVREYHIQVPPGFESVEEFCAQLNHYLTSLHTAVCQPLEQTLRGGTQTRGNLFNDQQPLIQALIGVLKPCIQDYIDKTRSYAGKLPILTSTTDFAFSGSWSVRLAKQGLHTPHVHPMGWLSSAFYVQLPDSVRSEGNTQGWFKLGEPNLTLPQSMGAQKFVKPEVGKLVLFQSYMWHGTEPFDDEGTRTTVAFDVVPA